MCYKTVDDFLKNPVRKRNSDYGFDWDTTIFNVRIKNATGYEDIETFRELYEFVSNYDFSVIPAHRTKVISAEKLANGNAKRYERKEIYSINQIREAVKDVLFKDGEDERIILDGDSIHGNSQRYQLFFTKGVTCCSCGLIGQYFRKERGRADERYHLNLYGINQDGVEVMLTKDHIIPRSKGGKNTLENYQTMCQVCNLKKGDRLEG